MRNFLLVVLMAAFLAPCAFASTTPAVTPEPLDYLNGSESVEMPDNAIGWSPQAGELDEIIGDTLIVGTSGWDAQHNGGVGRQIGYFHDNGGDGWVVEFFWSRLEGLSPSDPRHVVHAAIMSDGAGGFMIDPFPASNVENEYRSGYMNVAMDAANGIAYPTYHKAVSLGDDFSVWAAAPSPFIPNFYNQYEANPVFALPHIWPHSVYGPTGHIHTIAHEQRDGNTDLMQISYMRWEDQGQGTLVPATPDDNPFSMLDYAMNISGDITTNLTGDKVVMGCAVNRLATLGEDFAGPGEDEQFNNDLYLFFSEDGGETWDLDNPYDASKFIGPDINLLPDTTAANKDTFRVYTDCSLVFDNEDSLYSAFSVQEFDFLRESGFVMSAIFVHQRDPDGNDWWSLVNHQPFTGVTTEAWGRTTDRPSLTFDTDTGILWCVMRNIDGIAQATGDTTDFAEGFYGNADILVSASPPGMYNGLLWTEPVNITNTEYTGVAPAPAGECMSETDPSVALRSEGDYLHIQYLLDLHAGTGITDPPENTVTDNPIVYHRVSKQELLDQFEADSTWQVNYPMHVDSSGFWQDPGDYAWAEWGGFFTQDDRGTDAVGENGSLQPTEFDLKQNYPNPFNPSTRIEFSLDRPATVKLAVYDVLGREVTTLLDRGMKAGSHDVTFLADNLPSGVYFYKLQAGEFEKTRKMVLMK